MKYAQLDISRNESQIYIGNRRDDRQGAWCANDMGRIVSTALYLAERYSIEHDDIVIFEAAERENA